MKFLLGPGLHCDLQSLIDTRALVQANSGGGKSHTLRRLLEQTHGHVQQLVIDPEGEFASLREKYDYVYAAKSGGDTAADPRSAKLLAERLLELGTSVVLDIYELKAHERIRFVRLFLEALVDAPKKLWHPALVVVDEAHVYCPQKGEAESASAVIDLATRGRKRGFSAVLATQRLSKLHKDAAAELNNKLIGRTGLDVDIERAAEELGFRTREDRYQLRDLEPGEFFAFGPALSRAVTKVKVAGVQTTHPQAGARLSAPTPPPTAKIKALLPKLADLPAEAEQKQRTEAELKRDLSSARARITQLERAAPTRTVEKIKTVVEKVEVPVLTEAQVRRLETAAHKIDDAATGALQAIRDLKIQVAPKAGTFGTVRPQVVVEPRRTRTETETARPVPKERPPTVDGDLNGPEQRILNAIAWLEAIGVTDPKQPAVAFLAGYTYGGGAFNNPKGALRGKGLVSYKPGDSIALTDEGRAAAVVPDAPLSVEELHRRVLGQLPKPEQRILQPLLNAYPESLSKAELAAEAGYAPGAGAFNNPCGRLRSLGLIEYPDPGRAVALPLLFFQVPA